MNCQFSKNDVVLAKVKGYDYWPGLITETYENNSCNVLFFYECNYAKLKNDKIKKFNLENLNPMKISKKNKLYFAYTAALDYIYGKTTWEEHFKQTQLNNKRIKTGEFGSNKEINFCETDNQCQKNTNFCSEKNQLELKLKETSFPPENVKNSGDTMYNSKSKINFNKKSINKATKTKNNSNVIVIITKKPKDVESDENLKNKHSKNNFCEMEKFCAEFEDKKQKINTHKKDTKISNNKNNIFIKQIDENNSDKLNSYAVSNRFEILFKVMEENHINIFESSEQLQYCIEIDNSKLKTLFDELDLKIPSNLKEKMISRVLNVNDYSLLKILLQYNVRKIY